MTDIDFIVFNNIDRLSMAYARAGRAAEQATKAINALDKFLNSGRLRRIKMYYRRAYRHGSIK